MCIRDRVCADCKTPRHRDRYSGYCSWNTSNFTLPVEERTPDNPKIRRPTQENAGGSQQPRDNKYINSCAATVNQVIDKIIKNQNEAIKPQGADTPICDASSWTDEELKDFMQHKRNTDDTSSNSQTGQFQVRCIKQSPRLVPCHWNHEGHLLW